MIKDEFVDLITRKNDRFYDYLILNIRNIKEFEKISKIIEELDVDLFFIINNYYKTRLYIQVSGERLIVQNKLRKIHNYWRINFKNDIGYKRSSKHSVFFEGKNLILNKVISDFKPIDILQVPKFSGILNLNNKNLFFKLDSNLYLS